MKNAFAIVLILITSAVYAQQDSVKTSPFSLSGYADVYYTYDFSNPISKQLPGFPYSHSLHNEISLNNAIVAVRYTDNKVRGAVALHTGSYVMFNYAAEPELFRNIYEANAGFEVLKNVWLDAGVFTSHIGFESAISKDNLTLTRSMYAENSPYYECGAKLTYSKSENFTASALVLNGWQRIKDNNANKAFGTQLQFKPIKNILINSSTFFGSEMPDSAYAGRFFHDFYISWAINKKLDLLALYDFGFQENSINNGYDQWDAGALIIRYKPVEKFRIAARGEFYQDMDGVIVTGYEPFFTKAFSLNLDYLPSDKVMFRIEGKNISGNQEIFSGKNYAGTSSTILTISTSVSIN